MEKGDKKSRGAASAAMPAVYIAPSDGSAHYARFAIIVPVERDRSGNFIIASATTV